MSIELKPATPAYYAASMVMAAVDAFATLITGERHYFWADGSSLGGNGKQALEDQLDREKGDIPWDR